MTVKDIEGNIHVFWQRKQRERKEDVGGGKNETG